MAAVVPQLRARVVEEKAAEARRQHGRVWNLALKVEAAGSVSDTLTGTYIHAGCPMGFPVWAKVASTKLRPAPMPDRAGASVFLSYNVTADPCAQIDHSSGLDAQ